MYVYIYIYIYTRVNTIYVYTIRVNYIHIVYTHIDSKLPGNVRDGPQGENISVLFK